MKIEFTKHSDTSLGRAKIGEILDLPMSEAKELVAEKKAKKVGKQTVDEFFVLSEEEPNAD